MLIQKMYKTLKINSMERNIERSPESRGEKNQPSWQNKRPSKVENIRKETSRKVFDNLSKNRK